MQKVRDTRPTQLRQSAQLRQRDGEWIPSFFSACDGVALLCGDCVVPACVPMDASGKESVGHGQRQHLELQIVLAYPSDKILFPL